MRRLLLLLVVIALPSAQLWPQAQPGCSMRPQTLAQMRGCYRPLLVFAPNGSDPRLAAQRDALDGDADDMMDRFVLIVPVLAAGGSFKPPLDAPYAILSRAQQAEIRRRFHVAPTSYRVFLLGEDGGVKLHAAKPVSFDRINSLIDTMPTRRIEMQRPHSN